MNETKSTQLIVPPGHDDGNSGLALNDILFILFRHKRKIIFCTLAGLVAAITVYVFTARNYESVAKLYVVQRTIDPVDPQLKLAAASAETIINSEVEILTSMDLATQVVKETGLETLMPGVSRSGGEADALRTFVQSMKVVPLKGSNVIAITYRNRDPELTRAVLTQFVKRYFDKQSDAHRSWRAEAAAKEQINQAEDKLKNTEEELEKEKQKIGIRSLAESTSSVNARIAKAGQELLVAEADLSGQRARLKEIERSLGETDADQSSKTEVEANAVNGSDVQRYQLLGDQIAQLRKTELDLLAKYTPQSRTVGRTQNQIRDLDRERRELEAKHPVLATLVLKTSSTRPPQLDLVPERSNVAAAVAKVETLKTQLGAAEELAATLAKSAPVITKLERDKEMQEANIKYIQSSRSKATVDEVLDPSQIPNISIIQKPSIGVRVAGEAKKLVLGLVVGGLGLGIGIALLIELVLNRSVRGTLELETRLKIPQLLAIPFFSDSSRLQLNNAGKGGDHACEDYLSRADRAKSTLWDMNPLFRPFAEEIRDRLLLWFNLKNLTHKPKLVGIAGLSGEEGASTIAGSLAVVLSETGDGKVLLVDMYSGHSEAHPFFDGKPACGLADALERNGSLSAVTTNLYLASGVSEKGGMMQLAGKRFYSLVPNLKASHFDYIIFDLPPVSVGSATLAIAGCLDKLLLVVEAEKSDRDEIKRAYVDLVAAKAEVSAILNKTRCGGPKWLTV